MIEITDIPTAATVPSPKSKKPAKKSPPGIGGLINLALMAWMIWDLRHRSDEELNGKRRLWMIAAFVPPFGPIAYFIYFRRRKVQALAAQLESAD
jgi:hypothetical protein